MIYALSNLIYHIDFSRKPRYFNYLLDVLEGEQQTVLVANCQLR